MIKCGKCLHRYICYAREDNCKDYLIDRWAFGPEVSAKDFYDKIKEHLCNYDLPNYHSFKAIEEETLDDLAKELGII
jgi:hypothetical protein